jgi:hypothetical protein
MTKQARRILFGVFLGVALPLLGQTAPPATLPPEEATVRATVERYLHGLKFNDVESLAKAFRPDARLFFVKKDGTLGELTQQNWYEGFRVSAVKEEEGDLAIAALDVTGNAASVKVVENYPHSRYTDYLSLLKIDGSWWIVNKIYFAEKR